MDMQIEASTVRPLFSVHFEGIDVARAALSALVPSIGELVKRLARGIDPRELVSDVFVDLLGKLERGGLRLTTELAEASYVSFFARCVINAARDALRKRTRVRTREVELDREPPDSTTPGSSDEQEVLDAEGLWARLRAADCPPAYRITLLTWYRPAALCSNDLDDLKRQPVRGKTHQASGLVRALEPAWMLLQKLRHHYPRGIARQRPGIDRFAFTVRSDAPRFKAWTEDGKALIAARETVGKWHTRGRQWLETHGGAMKLERPNSKIAREVEHGD